jgi:hypothetical protein
MVDKPSIERDRAIGMAKQAAHANGHVWEEPSFISEHGDELHVSSNAAQLGGNVLVVMERATGRVLRVNHYNR